MNTAVSRPEDYTDGWRVYEVRQQDQGPYTVPDYTIAAKGDDSRHFIYLTSSANGYCVDSLQNDADRLPPPCQLGDTVRWVAEGAMVFFDRTGRAYASMKPCDRYYGNAPEKMRYRDSLSLIPHGCLPDGAVSFLKDVSYRGQQLIHVKVGNQHRLLQLTEKGANVYQAVWSKQYKRYARGRLLRQVEGAPRIDWNRGGLPFVDILNRYYTRAMYRRLISLLEWSEDDSRYKAYREVIELMEAGAPE